MKVKSLMNPALLPVEKVKTLGKSLLEKSPLLSRGFHHLHGAYHSSRLALSNPQGKAPLLIYQMGKVGSSSLSASLEALELPYPVYHVHYLSAQKIAKVRAREVFPYRPIAAKDHWASRYLQQRLQEHPPTQERWKLISLVREPVARNISAFFQNIHWLYPDFYRSYRAGTLKVETLIAAFLADYPHTIPLEWFDEEMKAVFGIDVYAQPFPKAQGYARYSGATAELLVIRLEELDSVFAEAVGSFLGLEGVSLSNANVAADKAYHEIYRHFRKELVLPPEYLEKMYSSSYVRHFYTAEEIAAFQKKWRRDE